MKCIPQIFSLFLCLTVHLRADGVRVSPKGPAGDDGGQAAAGRREVQLPPLSSDAQRRWLNEHVIASAIDGLAVDPYTCLVGPAKSLQISADGEKGRELLEELKFTYQPNPKVDKQFVFRDYVLRNMLQKAQASGKPIVIFVHGGLNYLNDAIKRAAIDGPIAEKECYPIYVCWDSSFSTSYWEHLTQVRNGTNLGGDQPTWGWATAPIYFFTDVATSVVRTPRMLVDLGRSNLKGWSFPKIHHDRDFGDVQDAQVRYFALREAAGGKLTPAENHEKDLLRKKLGVLLAHDGNPPTQKERDDAKAGRGKMKLDVAIDGLKREWGDIHRLPGGTNPDFYRPSPQEWEPAHVSRGRYEPEFGDSTMRLVEGWSMAVPKLVVLAALGGAGGDMWDVMSRRTQVMYHYEPSFRPAWGSGSPHSSYRETNSDTRDSQSTGIGCMAVFLRSLQEAQDRGQCQKVSLVGHSMGAMILDQGLEEFPSINYKDIVYLAPACSIRDFNSTAIRYMERQQHAKTQFFAVCLHPRAEDRDISFGELVPRASLPIWIDEFLGHPQSFTDRTLGNFENAMLASRLFPPRLQNRLHFTALATGPAAHEFVEHGEFSEAAFWRPKFYEAAGDVSRKADPSLNLANKANQAERDDNARRYLPGGH